MAEKHTKSASSTIRRVAALCGIGLAAVAASPASAEDIKSQLPADLVADHCLANGVGSKTEGTFILPDGKRLTGTVLCEQKDLAAVASPRGGDDDDEAGDDEDEQGDDDDEGDDD